MSYYKAYQNKIRWTCKHARLDWRPDRRGYICLKTMLSKEHGAHDCHDCRDYEHK